MSYAVVNLLMSIIEIYTIIVFVWVISSWLIGFNIVNPRNPTVRAILAGINALVEPVARPIRKILPAIGGLDLSPIVLLLGLTFIRNYLSTLA